MGTAYCSPPGGGAVNIMGTAYCGIGQCINIMGTAYCSNQEDCSAINIMGNAKCTGGCVSGDPNLCEILFFLSTIPKIVRWVPDYCFQGIE